MALDTSRTFCSAITDPERYAAYDFTTSTDPTEAQVEDYCYDVSAIITMQTERAGSRLVPPHSSDSVGLSRLLAQCNAVGAAYLARHHMYTLNGDNASLMVMQRLAGLWQAYMGEGSLTAGAGVPALTVGDGGLIAQAIGTSAGTRSPRSDVSEGDVTLYDAPQITNIKPTFSMDGAD